MSNRTIHLGFIHMSSWTAKSRLADDYYFDEADSYYDSPHAKKVRALDPNAVVLTKGTYTLKITYPLSRPFMAVMDVEKSGMTRRQLVSWIVKSYKAIYRKAGTTNPNGVWGHAMSDLMLHTATVSKKGVINVSCDS
jgi:hypothetical protein